MCPRVQSNPGAPQKTVTQLLIASRAGGIRRQRWGRRSRARRAREPNQRYIQADRRSGGRSHQRQMVFQDSHRGQQGRRDPRTSAEVTIFAGKLARGAEKAQTWKPDLAAPFHIRRLSSKPDRGRLSRTPECWDRDRPGLARYGCRRIQAPSLEQDDRECSRAHQPRPHPHRES
jgi:hypothetical protein